MSQIIGRYIPIVIDILSIVISTVSQLGRQYANGVCKFA